MSSSIVGQVLLGQYRVDAFVASGGMGTVYRVWDLKRNVSLAMKVLHADLAEDPAVFKRFQREARALQKLAHPHIVPFYGLYQARGMAFLLERFIDGPSLKELLRQRKGKPQAVGEALIYLKAVSSALGYAHAHSVVHCDVKPGNVMVDQGGSIYLTDFGVARHAESTTTTLAVAGTAAYMAPEQVRGEAVSAETDGYALGVMLYEMLTGERPFRGDERGTESGGATAAERIRYGHLHLAPPDPRKLNPEVPEGLAGVAVKALAKRPEERYRATRELYEAVCFAVEADLEDVPDRVAMREDAQDFGIAPVLPGRPQQQSLAGSHPARLLTTVGARTILIGMLMVGSLASVLLIGRISSKDPAINDSATNPVPPTAGSVDAISPPSGAAGGVPGEGDRIEEKQEPRFGLTETVRSPRATSALAPSPMPELVDGGDGAPVVLIPAGAFTMGSDEAEARVAEMACKAAGDAGCTFDNEVPRREVSLDAFYIHVYEVTEQQYSGGSGQLPVVQVSWYEAGDYCEAHGMRLPTEEEWEKAARGTDGRVYPWGNTYDLSRLNSEDGGPGIRLPVGSFASGVSPYGVYDMAGNTWEWTSSMLARDYVVRGGSFTNGWWFVRAANRGSKRADDPTRYTGFRCVQEAP